MKRSSKTAAASAARRRNLTLTISEEVFRRARHFAVERGVSLSKLLSEQLESLAGPRRTVHNERGREPATSGVTGRRSNQLVGRPQENGSQRGSRRSSV